MRNRLKSAWASLRASYWFLPACIVGGSVAAAIVLVLVDTRVTAELAEWSPRLFGASADGSRQMLSAIATSMITVAGVVFSITILTLSQASTQYSPRVLRQFMRDVPMQVVLGVFVGSFAYCMVVLRTVRGSDNGEFIPSLAVLGGMVYALAGLAVLIFFIHHVAQGIQASSILARIAADTRAAIDHLFPEELGREPAATPACEAVPAAWTPLPARSRGYVSSVDAAVLLEMAETHGRVIRLPWRVGEFVSEGQTLLALSGMRPLEPAEAARLCDAVRLSRQRSVEQDAGFGFQQLVDVAVKALSPGINDPTTAAMCLDQLRDLLARVAGRAMPASHRVSGGELRVIAPGPDYAGFVDLALGVIVRQQGCDVDLLARVLQTCEFLRDRSPWPDRRRPLLSVTRAVRRRLSGARPRSPEHRLVQRLRGLERSLHEP